MGICRNRAYYITGIAALGIYLVPASQVSAQEAVPGFEEGRSGVAEIIVTAAKREQSLQDVSAAVNAYGGEQLASAHISTLEDLQMIAPGIAITNDFNLAKVFIRGIGLNSSVSGIDPAVALHVDGVVVSRPEAQLGSMFDLARVEVAKGPQGTLYGRNTTGGSINLVTAKPTRDLTGYGRVTYGNYDTMEFEGAVGGPIINDLLLARIAFTTQHKNKGFGVNPVTGNQVDNKNRSMGRLHLEFIPASNFDFLLTGEVYYQDDNSGALKFLEPSFPGYPGFEPTAGSGGFAKRPRDIASDIDAKVRTSSWSVTGTTTWNLSDDFKFINVTGYRDFLTAQTADLDISAIRTPTTQYRDPFSKQITTESRIHFDNDWLNAVAGFFYLHEHYGIHSSTLDYLPIIGQPGNLVGLAAAGISPYEDAARCNVLDRQEQIDQPTPIPPLLCGTSNLKTTAYAAFSQAVVNLGRISPGLHTVSLKLGGRYSHEKRFVSNPTTLILGGGSGPVVSIPESVSHNQRSFGSFDPEAGLEWRPNRDVLFYYTYSEGFKSGTGLTDLSGGAKIIEPERIKNHELGLRTSWVDGRVVINLSGFYYKLKDQQINKVFFDPVTQTTKSVFENAASSIGKGAEAEISIVPVNALRLSANISYLDAKFQDFQTIDGLKIRNVPGPRIDPSTPAYDPLVEQLAGNYLRNAPKWSSAFHVEYDIATNTSLPGYFTLSADVNHRSKIFFTEFNDPREGAQAVTMIDTAVEFTSDDRHWRASIWAKNLTNKLVKAGTFPIIGRIIGVQYLPPRTYGATLGYSF